MTNIHKSVSSATLISKIYRDFRPSDSRWTTTSLEWMFEGMQAIGYFVGFVNKSGDGCIPLKVTNFRVKIPCDVERILYVEYEGERLIQGSDFSGYLSSKGASNNASEVEDTNTNNVVCSNDNAFTGFSNPVGTVNRKTNDRTTRIEPDVPYFLLNPNYIHTSFETGDIKLHYIALPLDDEGLPLIVDEFHYKECITWYIIYKMIMSGYKHPEIKLVDAKNLFEEALPRAQNAAKFPSIANMEKLQNLWSRYTVNYRMPERFFQSAETAQYINR